MMEGTSIEISAHAYSLYSKPNHWPDRRKKNITHFVRPVQSLKNCIEIKSCIETIHLPTVDQTKFSSMNN